MFFKEKLYDLTKWIKDNEGLEEGWFMVSIQVNLCWVDQQWTEEFEMKHTTPLEFTALHPSYLTCGGNHSLVEKEPTNPRHSMFTNHVCSLNILRTQSPNSCPRFSSRSSWNCHIQFWGSTALHGVLFLIHLQSDSWVLLWLCWASNKRILRTMMTRPAMPRLMRFSTVHHGAVRLGIVDKGDIEVRAGQNYQGSPHVHPALLIPWTALSLCAQPCTWEFSLLNHRGVWHVLGWDENLCYSWEQRREVERVKC
jgi:hypothetical protein